MTPPPSTSSGIQSAAIAGPAREAFAPADPSFRALADGAADLVLRFDARERLLYVNRAYERLAGVQAADIVGCVPEELGLSAEQGARVRAAVARVLGGAVEERVRHDCTPADGVRRWFDSRFLPERDDDGAVRAVLCISRDVSAEVAAQEALRVSETHFRLLYEAAPVGIGRMTLDGHWLDANPPLCAMLGYTLQELREMTSRDVTHPGDAIVDGPAVLGGGADEMRAVKRYQRSDGTAVWAALTIRLVRGANGEPLHLVGIVEDVGERVAAERALRESEERFRALVEHSSDLIAILEPDGRVRYASPAQARLLGYAPDEYPELVAYDLLHPDDVPHARRRLADATGAVADDAGGERPIRVRRRDGAYRAFLVRATDMRANPAVRGIVVNARDVTEELRLQDRLVQAQKMEALGQLAGGVAHDFNNILAAITSYGQLLLDTLPPGGREAEDAAEVVKAATRGAAVTGQLLAFSRRQALETEVIELGAVVRDTARMLRPLLPASIALDLPRVEDPPVHVRAARAQIEQIILNLAVNARDAMSDGGALDVRVRARTQPASAEALLVVSDTGVGMIPSVRARAFEPFFTTKPAGRGTGLGLATVYGLARQFGGTVEVESAEGAGTTFTVVLPLVTPPAVASADDSPRRLRASRGARLLLAEDEEQVRASLARALARAGYEVIAVADGAAALEALRGGERVDLVVSDVAMPRIGGRELAAAIAREWPALRVVLMSGYAELGGSSAPPSTEVAGFVAKPFDVARLVQLVEQVLERTAH